MDKSKQPGISFEGIILAKEKFWRDYTVPEEAVSDISISVKYNNEENNWATEFLFSLRLVYQEKDVLTLECVFVGFFSIIEGEENMDIERFVKNNSPALMFPYIREHVSTITQKAGIKPVLLAPVNVIAMLEDA